MNSHRNVTCLVFYSNSCVTGPAFTCITFNRHVARDMYTLKAKSNTHRGVVTTHNILKQTRIPEHYRPFVIFHSVTTAIILSSPSFISDPVYYCFCLAMKIKLFSGSGCVGIKEQITNLCSVAYSH